jgi:large subunit ribosomal protein L19
MDVASLIKVKQNPNIPTLAPGDTVRVSTKVVEGDKERTQLFQGVIIKVRHGGAGANFTVRRVTYGVGVERTFPIYSPLVEKVEVARHGKVRRAKLYYLRGRSARASRIKERRLSQQELEREREEAQRLKQEQELEREKARKLEQEQEQALEQEEEAPKLEQEQEQVLEQEEEAPKLEQEQKQVLEQEEEAPKLEQEQEQALEQEEEAPKLEQEQEQALEQEEEAPKLEKEQDQS